MRHIHDLEEENKTNDDLTDRQETNYDRIEAKLPEKHNGVICNLKRVIRWKLNQET